MIWQYVSRLILRFRLPIILVIAAITVVMGYFASKAEMTYTMAQILPFDDPEYVAYTNFNKKFGHATIKYLTTAKRLTKRLFE